MRVGEDTCRVGGEKKIREGNRKGWEGEVVEPQGPDSKRFVMELTKTRNGTDDIR